MGIIGNNDGKGLSQVTFYLKENMDLFRIIHEMPAPHGYANNNAPPTVECCNSTILSLTRVT